MRPNVAISGLLACSVGISTASTIEGLGLRQNSGPTVSKHNSVITIKQTFPDISSQPAIQREVPTNFLFETNGAEINTVRLKRYNALGNGISDETIAYTAFQPSEPTSDTDGQSMLTPEGGTGPDLNAVLNPMPNNSLTISWVNSNQNISDKPLYLECEWTRSATSGNSTTQLFAVYEGADPSAAIASLNEVRIPSNAGYPARPETTTVIPQSPTGTTNPEVSSSGTATATATSMPAPNGLSRNSIIGIAVGVGGGALLIAAALLWFFCIRRRRRTATHHAMPSYASDVGVHAMMQDKEIPAVRESSSPHYGGSHDEGRSSTDHYAPYSDRSTTSPTPDHHRRTASGADVGAQTRGAPSPTPAIMSRYAHLVEEGMTDDEIRRLEEEERQLDAEIENAGRRGNS